MTACICVWISQTNIRKLQLDVRDWQWSVLLENITIALLFCSSIGSTRIHGVCINRCTMRGPTQVHGEHIGINDGKISDFEGGRDDCSGKSTAFGDALFAIQCAAWFATTEEILWTCKISFKVGH
jgi:hypothetical protein